MRWRIVLLVIAGVLLASCGTPQPASYGPAARACDDGGDGGVVIDGVCL